MINSLESLLSPFDMHILLLALWLSLATVWGLAFHHLGKMIGGYKYLYLPHLGVGQAASLNLLMAGLCVTFALLFLFRREKWVSGLIFIFALGVSFHVLQAVLNIGVLKNNGHLEVALRPFVLASMFLGGSNTFFVGMPTGNYSLLILPIVSLVLVTATAAYAKRSFIALGLGIGFPILAFGATGLFFGVPYWKQLAAQEDETERYFQEVCQTKAQIQLPATAVNTTGVVLFDPHVARQSFLSSNDDYRAFIDPAHGRFQVAEIQMIDSKEFFSVSWDAELSTPNEVRTTKGFRIASPTQTVGIRSAPVTTSEEIERGIEGAETVITNLQTNEVLARQVVYVRYIDKNDKWKKFQGVCPKNSLDEKTCTANGCSVLPFVLSAVHPVVPDQITRLYHLNRGVGRYKGISCASQVSIGPGIAPEDIEWWAFGDQGINLRVSGSNDHVYCENFGYGGRSPKLIFADGRSAQLNLTSFPAEKRGTDEQPRRLIDTMERR